MNQREAEDVIAEVLHQVAPNIDLQAVDRGQDLRRSLDLDSVDFLTVLQRLAERTGVDIPEGSYEQVATLEDMVEYLVDRTPG